MTGYPTVKNVEDMFIRFDRMYERDGHQTDTQTPHDDIGCTCIASCSKNWQVKKIHYGQVTAMVVLQWDCAVVFLLSKLRLVFI